MYEHGGHGNVTAICCKCERADRSTSVARNVSSVILRLLGLKSKPVDSHSGPNSVTTVPCSFAYSLQALKNEFMLKTFSLKKKLEHKPACDTHNSRLDL